MLPGVVDLDYEEEVGLLLHKGGKEKYVSSTGEPFQYLLVLTGPVIKVNGKLQHYSGRTTDGPHSSRMNIWVTPPSKEP